MLLTKTGGHAAQGEWDDDPSDGTAWEAAAAQPKPVTSSHTASELKAPAGQRSPAPQLERASQPDAQQPAAPRNQPARGNTAAKPEAAASAAAAQRPAQPAAGNIPNKSTAKRLFTAEAALVTTLISVCDVAAVDCQT